MSKTNPQETILRLISEKFPSANSVFWAGSVSKNLGNHASDLDLVIILGPEPAIHRKAFVYDGWLIDAFIHDLASLQAQMKLEAQNGKPGLISMILEGKEISGANETGHEARQIAQIAYDKGPIPWSKPAIDKERFLITDILDDITHPRNREEQITSAAHLFEPLLQFYFRATGRWTASGKTLIRLLQSQNPGLAEEYIQSFQSLFSTGDVVGVENVANRILDPYGGKLWDGFCEGPDVELDPGAELYKLKIGHQIG